MLLIEAALPSINENENENREVEDVVNLAFNSIQF
jgi:hypothetical protein